MTDTTEDAYADLARLVGLHVADDEPSEIVSAAADEIRRLRDGLKILADPNSFKGSDGAIPVRVSNFAAGVLNLSRVKP